MDRVADKRANLNSKEAEVACGAASLPVLLSGTRGCETMAKDYACKVIDPRNPQGSQVNAIFPLDLALRYYRSSPVRYENLRAAKYVLEHTQRIFSGVREFNQGGWCYTGRPTEWCIKERVTAPFPPEKVFAVYLNPNMRVYECRAEYSAKDDPLCPLNWQERYRGLIWRSTS
jgi:hypothetical protein